MWTTDKDGIILALLASEILAVTGSTPSQRYDALAEKYGAPTYARIDAPADREQKARLAKLSPEQVTATELAGEPITAKLTTAPGNGAPLGGLKVTTENAWFAARPSGTEDVYKIYAESFKGPEHLAEVQEAAKEVVNTGHSVSSDAEGDCSDGTPSKPKLPREVWVLVAANVVVALGYGVVAPVLPQYARNFGVSISAATFVITAFALMRLVVAPPAGLLVQRLGERRVYISGLLIVAVSTGACAFARDLLAAAAVPVARRARVGDVHRVVAGSDDPDLAAGRARPRRRPVLVGLPDRLGGRAGARQPDRGLRAWRRRSSSTEWRCWSPRRWCS